MTHDKINQLKERLNYLDIAIAHQFETIDDENPEKANTQMLSAGEKIAVNQERGSIRSKIAFEENEITKNEVREYQVSKEIEAKLDSIHNEIRNKNWIRK